MKYVDFLEKQERIYSEFRDTSQIQLEGLKPKIEENKGGYIIALRHSYNVVNDIKNITSKVYDQVNCIEYDESNIHTTIATYNESFGFKANNEVLEILVKIAENNISAIKDVKIDYIEMLINQDTAIVAGIPSESFVEYINSIEREAQSYNIKVKRPWGAHITIGRFLESTTNKKFLKLLGIVKECPKIGLSNPLSVDVGYFTLVNNTFILNVYKSIKL